MPTARLIIDPPAEGSWNMAVDEALLESAAESGQIVLRFYEWIPATLSLGYFQVAADRQQHLASSASPMVRRTTGGGAIVHDHELTYSLIVPVSGRFSAKASALYNAMHGSLVDALAAFDIEANLHTAASMHHAPLTEPFLCFQRRAAGDVLVRGQKIAGSAQRRQRGTILQHGSVILRRSQAAPEIDGLQELGRLDLTAETLATRWLRGLTTALSLAIVPGTLCDSEIMLAQKLQIGKFACPNWTERR